MKNVADLAGVGVKTVSRVINQERYVSADTIARVMRAAEQLQYQPDVQAGNLRRADRRTDTLGLLVGSVANPFSAAVHRAVEDAAVQRHVAVFASSLDDDPERERASVEAFLRRRVDGLILTTIQPSQAYLWPQLEQGMPVVFVDRKPNGVMADTVLTDNLDGAARATRHLLDAGHRRIAFLGDSEEIYTVKERRRGYLDALRAAGIAPDPRLVIENLGDEVQAESAVRSLLALDDPPTAIFSAQNLITIGAITALRAHGVSDRVALVGFDDVPMASLLSPAVTVIAQDPSAIGALAARRIFERLDGETEAARDFVVPTRLIERGSGEIRPA
ncbi:LacI family DNA-binding transcriptional regulator [Herbiconiux sp. VKM Ac-1786]|uniref:LacI family DNA-binding transcriptional regulator n=1 Tax=Herbiconiux sp. VKM Ac-1786 TaxID=2783824 RepID=UPI00188CA0AF|nr:LacI family DNA-binding transcriptional regulator [Herbiconiux sp. VKM Ac-1786]MBF4572164.1 LacI family DNA-binding transcriptional regulator [Herbiconiux sp. VKM Ac-1786]